jgi:type VI secretion system secreted protein VgrG
MEIATPLGGDVLLFHGMHAREGLSQVSEFQIDLLSRRGDVEMDDILGKPVTVSLALPDDRTRYFHGLVTRFGQSGTLGRYHRYTAIVHPWLWLLSRTADCRIFQDMTVPDILKKVFTEHGMADFVMELTAPYQTWVYCVQYRETALNFVSRLMEHEGIYYYFRHTDGRSTMVVTDSYAGHRPCEGAETIAMIPAERLVRPDIEHISSWELGREIQPGVYVHTDYDPENPGTSLQTRKSLPRTYDPSKFEVFDYPGDYTKRPQGELYAGIRINEYGSQFETARGTTNVRALTVGSLFTLEGCAREDQNQEHLVLGGRYDLTFSDYEALPDRGGASYRCRFAAMTSKQEFRPKRATPKPFVQGPQTAVVVGPAGDEIHTDKYGRVKVQFHWDREGKKDAKSSCWIRVSHPWAGKGWGAVATPRIGQEVIVDFLEGDPDRPIITGRVYNAEQLPPFGFPKGAVLSGVKSDTHLGHGYNEMSMDDTAGTEKITIHAQYDMNTTVLHDQTTTVHNNRTDRVDVDDVESIGNNQTWDVGANRTATIGANEALTVQANRTKDVIANETITVGGNRSSAVSGSETVTVAMQRTHSVGINETISVGAAQEITVGAMQAFTVGANQTNNIGVNQSTSVGKDQSNTIGSNQSTAVGKALSTTVGTDESRKVSGARGTEIGKDDALKVGKNLVMEAGDSIVLKTGSATISMKKDGTIVIKGKNITVEGSGKINVKASSDVIIKGSKVGIN